MIFLGLFAIILAAILFAWAGVHQEPRDPEPPAWRAPRDYDNHGDE